MKRSTRHMGWFAIAVLALIAVVVWQLRNDRRAAPGTLLAIDPGSITRVNLKLGSTPTEHYVKRDDHWWRVDQAAPVRADDMRLGELVDIAAAPVQSWQAAAIFDPSKIGLSPPQAKLDLDGQTILFGGMTAIGQRGYVQVGDRVGMVSLRYMPRSAQSSTIKAL